MSDDTPDDGTTTDSIDRLTRLATDQLTSRRNVLAGAATVGVGALASIPVSGQEGDGGGGGDGGMNGSDGGESSDEGPSDLEILNYALTLEHLEATFYARGLEDFSDEELMTADAVCDRLCAETRELVPMWVQTVGDHEAAHVDQIATVIENLGGDPVQAAEYDFGYESPSQFLSIAKALENTGVAAYAGAAPSLKSDKLLAAALSIHSVEARHAGTFNFVNGASPFPHAFDEPKTMEEVLQIAGQFIVSE